jgi:hypothetical protein
MVVRRSNCFRRNKLPYQVWILNAALIYSILCLISCEGKDICQSKFGKIQSGECIVISDFVEDSILLVGPHIYPEEVEAYTGIEYSFRLQTDPNHLLLYMKSGKIVREERGRCSLFILPSEKHMPDGISVVRKGDCLILSNNQQGASFLRRVKSPAQ